MRRVVGAALVLACAVACGSGPPPGAWPPGRGAEATFGPPSPLPGTPLPTQSPDHPGFPAYAATARIADVAVYDAAGGRVRQRLANPQPSGAPLTFLVRDRAQGWWKVLLPVRPNGSTGWVRAADVEVRGVPYRIDVLRGAHELRLYERDTLVHVYPVGIGTTNTPTPGGEFYIKELLIPTNPGGFYGPYAYGLSGYSNVLDEYAGGGGVIGIHGTSEPGSIGHDASHGCIRMRNSDITELVELLPLGTPVRVLA